MLSYQHLISAVRAGVIAWESMSHSGSNTSQQITSYCRRTWYPAQDLGNIASSTQSA